MQASLVYFSLPLRVFFILIFISIPIFFIFILNPYPRKKKI